MAINLQLFRMLILKKIILVYFLLAVLFLPIIAVASITTGTIDSTYKYAWSNNIGWINFAPTGTGSEYLGLVITDSSVTGYAWSNQYGWINFGPFQNNTGGGVRNNSAGVLSGYAWSKNLGWINFTGVIINSSGQFTGTAQGTLVGTINFNLTRCVNCGVITDWRPESARPTTVAIGGGGSFSSIAYSQPSAPVGGFGLLIDDGRMITSNPIVTLQFQAGSDIKKMAISNSPGFENASQEDYQPTKKWTLAPGDGPKTVYVKFYTQYGQSSQVIPASIVLSTPVAYNNVKNNSQILAPLSIKQNANPQTVEPLENGQANNQTVPVIEKIQTLSSNNANTQPEFFVKITSLILKGVKFFWTFIANLFR